MYKIFNKYATRGIDTVIGLSKEDLESLKWKEDNGGMPSLTRSEVGCLRTLNNYIQYLKQKGEFTSNTVFRHNASTREIYEEFKGGLISIHIQQSSGDLSANPPPRLAGSSISSGSSGKSSHQLALIEYL